VLRRVITSPRDQGRGGYEWSPDPSVVSAHIKTPLPMMASADLSFVDVQGRKSAGPFMGHPVRPSLSTFYSPDGKWIALV